MCICVMAQPKQEEHIDTDSKKGMLNIIVWFVLFVLDPGDVLVKGRNPHNS